MYLYATIQKKTILNRGDEEKHSLTIMFYCQRILCKYPSTNFIRESCIPHAEIRAIVKSRKKWKGRICMAFQTLATFTLPEMPTD